MLFLRLRIVVGDLELDVSHTRIGIIHGCLTSVFINQKHWLVIVNWCVVLRVEIRRNTHRINRGCLCVWNPRMPAGY